MLYVMGVGWLRDIAGDMTVVQCLLLVIGIESCIRCGLIPSNTGYRELFAGSELRALITDLDWNVLETSIPSAVFSKEILQEAAEHSIMLDQNTLLKSSPIRKGYVFWQEDIGQLRQTLDRLRLVQEELRETGDILKEENIQKSRRLKIQEKTQLYDLVEQESAPQFIRLDMLLTRLAQTQSLEEGKALLARIGVIMTYIKRRSNLVFLAAQSECMESKELALCLHESVQALELCNVVCAVTLELAAEIPAAQVIALYDLFGAVLDRGKDTCSLLFYAGNEDGGITARIVVRSAESMTSLSNRFPELRAEQEDDAWYLTWQLGGEMQDEQNRG